MPAPLVKTPASIGLTEAPWPPGTPNKRPATVQVGDSFLDVCNREGCSFAALIRCNFEIDIDQPNLKGKWEWVVNYYLQTKLKCTRLTAGGNYMFSGGETIYIPTQSPVPAQPAPAPTVQRISLRRSILDKTLTKHFVDILDGGDPRDRAAEKFHDISWKMVYRDYDPQTGMYMPSPKNSQSTPDALLVNPRERVISEQTIQTEKSNVLLRVIVHTMVEYVAPSILPDPGLNFQLGGEIWHRRREFFYGPGDPNQQVTVVQQVLRKKAGGTIESRPPVVTYIPQPEDLAGL
ncbi:MAG: hypothetical protein IT165_34335 [Bryobacterales bacterium]|nr:hypothetical protein [Bryobacterales bacterium]